MNFTSRRLEQAVQARDERLALRWLESHEPPVCAGPGCGKPLPTVIPGTVAGRTRQWCSDACRQRAYRARKKKAVSMPATSPDLTAGAASPEQAAGTPAHELNDCILAVLASPSAIAAVLDVARRALRDGRLDASEYDDVQVALLALYDEMRSPSGNPRQR